MILKLNKLLLTSTHTGNVWLALIDAADAAPGGWYTSGGYLVTAFAPAGRVWISNQYPEACGEGMQTTAEKLEAFLIDRLMPDGGNHAEVERQALNAALADYYRKEF